MTAGMLVITRETAGIITGDTKFRTVYFKAPIMGAFLLQAWHTFLINHINLYMNDPKEKLREQEAPEKNTDNAFVQVSSDGSPEMPEAKEQDEAEEEEE